MLTAHQESGVVVLISGRRFRSTDPVELLLTTGCLYNRTQKDLIRCGAFAEWRILIDSAHRFHISVPYHVTQSQTENGPIMCAHVNKTKEHVIRTRLVEVR